MFEIYYFFDKWIEVIGDFYIFPSALFFFFLRSTEGSDNWQRERNLVAMLNEAKTNVVCISVSLASVGPCCFTQTGAP